MNGGPAFHRLMADWFIEMQMRPFTDQPEVYVLSFANQSVHYFSRHPGTLDILAEAGVLVNRSAADVLLRLTGLNYTADASPLLCIYVDPESGKIYVRTQSRISACTTAEMHDLTSRVRACAAAVHDIIDDKTSRAGTGPVSASTGGLAMLQLRGLGCAPVTGVSRARPEP